MVNMILLRLKRRPEITERRCSDSLLDMLLRTLWLFRLYGHLINRVQELL